MRISSRISGLLRLPDKAAASLVEDGEVGYDDALDVYRARVNGVETTLLTALNAQVGALSAARAYRNAALNHTLTGNMQAITFDTEVFDTNSCFTTGSGTRMTFTEAGKYLVEATAGFAAQGTGVRAFELRVTRAAGGTELVDYSGDWPADGTNIRLYPLKAIVDALAGDYVEVLAFQNSGGNLAYNVSPSNCHVSICKLGAGMVIDKPYFRAYRNGAGYTRSSGDVVVFDAEEADPNAWYDPSTGRFQPTRAGRYRVKATVGLTAVLTVGKVAYLRLHKNGVLVRGADQINPQQTTTYTLSASIDDTIAMNGTTEYLEVVITHDNGGTVTLDASTAGAWTSFEGQYVGAT